MQQELQDAFSRVIQRLFQVDEAPTVELTRPDSRFGDYATNIALQLARPLGRPPRAIAEALAPALAAEVPQLVERCDIAGPGFINLWLPADALWSRLDESPRQPLMGQTIVAEYSDPNPFKMLHAGHLYTSVVGDAISSLLEAAGAKVYRVNFGGDVGLHVAKNLWGIIQRLDGERPEGLESVKPADHAAFLADCYVAGHRAYEDGAARDEIIALNKRVYRLHAEGDTTSPLARIYWTCRQWSYDYFDAFYVRIGSRFDKYYPESQTAAPGLEAVRAHPDVFTESDGAIVFDGEQHGLHTRVFITREGLPTYETKDMGATLMKHRDYGFDQSVIITGNDIIEYMKVVLKATEQFAPEIARATRHLTHGNVKLSGGVKMSSRLGNVLAATDVLEAADAASRRQADYNNSQVTLGAVKYSFLKQRMGGDIIYDPDESVSLEGNSGPYLQYAHARACSILAKAPADDATAASTADLNESERNLLVKLGEYPEVIEKATRELLPHQICTYLYELAQEFNRFYEQNRVIGDERQAARLRLVRRYRTVLAEGLGLLGVAAPERL